MYWLCCGRAFENQKQIAMFVTALLKTERSELLETFRKKSGLWLVFFCRCCCCCFLFGLVFFPKNHLYTGQIWQFCSRQMRSQLLCNFFSHFSNRLQRKTPWRRAVEESKSRRFSRLCPFFPCGRPPPCVGAGSRGNCAALA